MKLGDVYRHKENNSIIQIDSFAARMGKIGYGDSINLKLVVAQVLMDMKHKKK